MPISTHRYHIHNWRFYNNSLIQRGRITLWIDEKASKRWFAKAEKGKNGRPRIYSDDMILIALSLRSVFHLSLRSLQGFLESLMALMHTDLPIPSYTQIRPSNSFSW